MTILGISGSLRRGSTNTALLRAAAELAPEGVELRVARIGDLPLYDADIDDAETLAPVERLKGEVSAADAVLIATPEYNFGIPGPLKNAIDWASRPAFRSPFANKPVGVLGTAPGAVGTARAQGQLKLVLLGMASQVFPHRELALGSSKTRMDAEGRLTDEKSREVLAAFVKEFAAWVDRVKV